MENWLQNAINEYDQGNHKDGDILSHDWIKHALQIPTARNLGEVEQIQWLMLTRIEAFKDWLLVERLTCIKSVRGKGYWIVPPGDQAQVAAEEAMRMVSKGLQKGSKIASHARLADMDDHAKKRHTDTQVRLSGLGDMMRRQKRDVFKLFSPEAAK